jgi:hypothetical protein
MLASFTRLRALCIALTSLDAAYAQTGNPFFVEHAPAMANGACDLARAALQVNDLEYAHSLIHNELLTFGQAYPGIRVRPSDLLPSEQDNATEIHQATAGFCDQVRAAFSANDPAKAYVAAVKLNTILERRVANLSSTPQAKFARLQAAVSQLSGLPRFYRLVALEKAAFDADDFGKAGKYAHELLQTAERYPDDWNHGNALYFGNWMLGRVALRRPRWSFGRFLRAVAGAPPPRNGDLNRAGIYLLKAAAAPPGRAGTMNTFGPNTTLAKELLERGQSKVVVQFFALCAQYWKMDHGKLAEWTAAVNRGEMPKFGANLNY